MYNEQSYGYACIIPDYNFKQILGPLQIQVAIHVSN